MNSLFISIGVILKYLVAVSIVVVAVVKGAVAWGESAGIAVADVHIVIVVAFKNKVKNIKT